MKLLELKVGRIMKYNKKSFWKYVVSQGRMRRMWAVAQWGRVLKKRDLGKVEIFQCLSCFSFH